MVGWLPALGLRASSSWGLSSLERTAAGEEEANKNTNSVPSSRKKIESWCISMLLSRQAEEGGCLCIVIARSRPDHGSGR